MVRVGRDASSTTSAPERREDRDDQVAHDRAREQHRRDPEQATGAQRVGERAEEGQRERERERVRVLTCERAGERAAGDVLVERDVLGYGAAPGVRP